MSVRKNFIIPEAYDLVSSGLQKCTPFQIIFRLFQMLSTICFYYQSGVQAYEIDNVRFNYHLTAEFVACHSMGA